MRRRPRALSLCVTAGVLVLAAVLAVAAAAGLARRRMDGRFRRHPQVPVREEQDRLTEADLGHPLGRSATLVQFSSAFCAPCRAARLLLADVAARSDGVAHVEVDVAQRMDLVRRLDVARTPTTLVLGPRGEVAGRASGVPRRADVEAAISEAACAAATAHRTALRAVLSPASREGKAARAEVGHE